MKDMDTWKPLNTMVLVAKDEDIEKTDGGIILPSESKIPVITCRVLDIGSNVDLDRFDIVRLDKVLVNPSNAIPISFESSNKRFIINVEDILAKKA